MINSPLNRSGLTLKRISGASVAALLVAALSSPATAQSVETDAGLDLGVSVGSEDGSADLGADADLGLDADGGEGTSLTADGSAGVDAGFQFDQPNEDGSFDLDGILSLNTQSNLSASIDSTKVAFVDIDDALSAQAHLDLMTSLESDASVDEIRTAVGASAELSAVLEAGGYDADDVVGLEIEGNGTTMIYVADGVLNPSCDVVATKHAWADIEDIGAATDVSVMIAGECETDDLWINSDIKTAAMANAMIAAELEEGGFVSEDILAIELISNGHVSVFIDGRS